jgi:DNA-binding NarL/FixJ family response regulator
MDSHESEAILIREDLYCFSMVNRHSLTARQIEVLELLVRGHSAVEVSRRLVVAESTVRKHVAALKERSGAHSLHGLTAWAVRELGL